MLAQYLQAIAIKKAETFGTDEFYSHHGYYKAVERQIQKAYLTQKELLCILSLYDISDIPAIEVDSPILLDYIPQPRVLLDGVPTIITLDFIPQPRVIVIGIPITLDFVPQPRIYLDIPPAKLSLDYIPQPRVELSGVPSNLIIDFVPQPRITLVEEDGAQMVFVPQPRITLEGEITEGMVYWGFTPYNNTWTRSGNVAYMQGDNIIDAMLNATSYDSQGYLQKAGFNNPDSIDLENWQKNHPIGESTYMVFLIPVSAGVRTNLITPFGETPIGGTLDESTSGNEFPESDAVISINGISYYLYVGNIRRRYSGNYKVTK